MKGNFCFGIKSAKPVEIRPIDLLRYQVLSDGSYRVLSDAQLLLNQERIVNEIGEDNYNKIVRSMGMPSKVYAPGKYTDSELLKYQKSRYIQTASEMSAWVDSLVGEGESIRDSVVAAREAAIQEEIKKQAEAEIKSGDVSVEKGGE